MSSGVFGTVRPAKVNISRDVEILYTYTPSRGESSEDFNGFKKLESTECLVPSTEHDNENNIINGLYKLRLPLDKFNKKGIYTLYVRPKERKAKIVDVSKLAAYPDVKGIVLDLSYGDMKGLDENLIGYRIEFNNGDTRLIKSCNRCEPIVVNTGDGYPKATRYNLTDGSSNYVFCTVSPSSSPTFRPNSRPYIGEPGVEVKVINTFFTPQLITVEMVDHDFDTISTMLEGSQLRDLDNGLITTFDENGQIYHQSEHYSLKNSMGKPVYEVKKEKNTSIDFTQTINDK